MPIVILHTFKERLICKLKLFQYRRVDSSDVLSPNAKHTVFTYSHRTKRCLCRGNSVHLSVRLFVTLLYYDKTTTHISKLYNLHTDVRDKATTKKIKRIKQVRSSVRSWGFWRPRIL